MSPLILFPLVENVQQLTGLYKIRFVIAKPQPDPRACAANLQDYFVILRLSLKTRIAARHDQGHADELCVLMCRSY